MRGLALLLAIALAGGCGRAGERAPSEPIAEVPGLASEPVTEVMITPELGAWAVVAPPLAPALRDARAERQAAEARAALANRQLRRLLGLGTDSAVPAKEIEAARAEAEMAEAALARARAQEAEFGGGSSAAHLPTGAAMLSIQVTQRDVARVRGGADVRFRPDDGSARELRGRIVRTPSYIDPATGLAPAVARLDGSDAPAPGTTGSAWIADGPAHSALTVPREALLFDGDNFLVFVLRGNAPPIARAVEVGSSLGERVEVRGEISPGDRVATTGAASLLSAQRLPSEADEG